MRIATQEHHRKRYQKSAKAESEYTQAENHNQRISRGLGRASQNKTLEINQEKQNTRIGQAEKQNQRKQQDWGEHHRKRHQKSVKKKQNTRIGQAEKQNQRITTGLRRAAQKKELEIN